MSLEHILFKILSLMPISFLRFVGYSRLGSKMVMFLKKRGEKNKKPFDIGDGIKIYADYTNPRELNLILGKGREDATKEVFLNNIKKDGVVIDCGANIGEFSLIAAKQVSPNGLVISIEPSKSIVTKLKENFLLNNFHNFKIIEIAVSDKVAKSVLYEHGVSELSSLDPNLLDKPATNTIEIQVDTLDNVIASNNIDSVAMLKMDIDGYEHEAFLGCAEAFKKNIIKNILCEVHYGLLKKKGIDEEKIYDLLKSNGFTIKIIDKDEVGKTVHILATNKKTA